MAKYPIKMLKDEEGKLFVPLVSTDSVQDNNGESLEEKFNKKLEPSNIIAGENIEISKAGNNCTIKAKVPASANIINNLTTAAAGQGVLDAYQGKVLNDKIPGLVNSLESTDANKALSANQGKILNDKIPGLVNSLDSTDTSKALTANQGKVLNDKFNSYFPKAGGTISGSVGIGKEPNHTLDVKGIINAEDIYKNGEPLYNGRANRLQLEDTRNDNQSPEWYMTNFTHALIHEFKASASINNPPVSHGFADVITLTPWRDESGGYPTQIAIMNNRMAIRSGKNKTSWNGWQRMATLSSAYPIGSIYISGNSTSPASLFGGTWQRLSGRFLYGYAGNAANVGKDSMSTYTGGQTTGHAITIEQMPSHNHQYFANIQHSDGAQVPHSESLKSGLQVGGRRRYFDGTETSGGGQPHTHGVPWLDVYIWQRTA